MGFSEWGKVEGNMVSGESIFLVDFVKMINFGLFDFQDEIYLFIEVLFFYVKVFVYMWFNL